MNNYQDFFRGKKITKQGFGVLGRGFGVVKFLAEMGGNVLVTDVKAKENFTEQIQELSSFPNIEYVLGEHREQDFTNCDFVIAGSGIPKDNHYINLAKQNNIPVYQETSLFAKLVKEYYPNTKIIGITGTRGKTTTTFLIYELLKKNFGSENVHIGGNVQGVATLEILKTIKDGDFVVLELDSWVLQGFEDLKISPNISVFTSFMPDHMNYYKNNLEEYFLDKATIFKYQHLGDVFITTTSVEQYLHNFLGKNYRERLNLESSEVIVDQNLQKNFRTKLLGSHNQTLLTLVEKVAESLKIDEKTFLEVVENFRGVAGRLELVKEEGSIKIYNDTCATTPDALIVALDSLNEILPENKKIFLICGGKDKELELDKLIYKIESLQERNALDLHILFDETTTGSRKLIEQIEDSGKKIEFIKENSLQTALENVNVKISEGDILLFSPGFASFGMFQNEYDRGDKFNALVSNF